MRFCFILFLFFFLALNHSHGQSDSLNQDSVAKSKVLKKKIYSGPRTASIKSAILPGLGQIQNKKYWKVPVIYAAIGGLAYFFQINNVQYRNYRQALKSSLDNGGRAQIDGVTYTTANLQVLKLQYKKTRDLAAIGIGIVYLLNIIDANVDAHLKTFDVSDDLSMSIKPVPYFYNDNIGNKIMAGFSLKLNFR